MSFQMGKQHLDFLASLSAHLVSCGVPEISNGLACFFIHMACDGSHRSICASIADRTGPTDFAELRQRLTRVFSSALRRFNSWPSRQV